MAARPWYMLLSITNFLEYRLISTCTSSWAIATNQSQKVFGVAVGGEFSAAINDCGLW